MARLSWQRAIFALIGATSGFLLALFFELTGHPSWYLLAMLVSAIVPSAILLVKDIPAIEALRQSCRRLPGWIKFGLILVMIAMTLGAEWVFDANPRDHSYLSLLVPVIVSAVLFGFGLALFTVAVTALGADYLFALPAYSFVLTEWEDALGLAVFAIIGAFMAMAIVELLNFGMD